jgi:polyhydroxybutyrate depolymerase
MTAMSIVPERRRRKGILSVVLILVSLPALVALAEAVSFYATNRSNGTIVSSGIAREYLVYVPRNYDRATPTPLVISMHGGAMWPAAQMEVDQWPRVADAHGFIVVYPSGVSGRGPRAWSAGREPGLARDVQFISELIDTLRAGYNIDPTRIYANGLSNGGGMSFALATAIFLPWTGCTGQRAVPMIVFQGTADRAVPYDGGSTWVAPDVFPSIPSWTARLAARNRCLPSPVESVIAADVTRIEYTHCVNDAAVVLYRIEGGGHTWPGATAMPEWFVGRTSNGVDATAVMWQFFREHRLAMP